MNRTFTECSSTMVKYKKWCKPKIWLENRYDSHKKQKALSLLNEWAASNSLKSMYLPNPSTTSRMWHKVNF